MAEYNIEITESLSRVVVCQADSLQQALEAVCRQYKQGDIVLDADDLKEVDFDVVGLPKRIPSKKNENQST